jgi:DNA-directed RNA polymerase II subunit RPB4
VLSAGFSPALSAEAAPGTTCWVPSMDLGVDQEENAENLKFGELFGDNEHCQPLLICEVAELLRQKRAELPAELQSSLGPIFVKSEAYVERFNQFRSAEVAKVVRVRLERHPELHPFERAQLANLLPETPAEAKAIIPSLKGKLDDDVLGQLLRDLAALVE